MASICIELAGRTIFSELPALVMGIVNVTPDSFWEQNRKTCVRDAVDLALKLADEGADIIDMGAESSRPGAEYIDESEEVSRLIPVLSELRRHTDCPVSVDTRKKNVFERAVGCGADILNDISALEDDSELGLFCAQKKTPVILMHKRGNPAIMQHNTVYDDVCVEVSAYLNRRKQYALSCGISSASIIADPGIGFGKDFKSNAALIQNCGCIGKELGCPVLIGLSRKSCIASCGCGANLLAGTLAANLLAVQNGASIVRVHDVRETVDMLKVLDSLQ